MHVSRSPLTFLLPIGLAVLIAITVALFRRNSRPRYYIHPRPLTSRVRGDFKSFSKAITAYYRDHGAWPTTTPLETRLVDKKALEKAGGTNLFSVSPGSRDRSGIMAPVQYVETIPSDVFFLREPGSISRYGVPYAYFAGDQSFILFSTGPDGVYDIRPGDDFDPNRHDAATSALLHVSYDPTNGSISPGDMWHIGTAPAENGNLRFR